MSMFKIQHLPRHKEWLARHLAEVQGDGAYRLARKVEETLVEGNRTDRLRGVDRLGKPLEPLRSKRKGRYAGATGTPLDPFDEASTAIRGFFARLSKNQKGWIFKVGVEGEHAHVLVYHATGTVRGAPKRDILGVTPKTRSAIQKVFKDWAAGLFRSR